MIKQITLGLLGLLALNTVTYAETNTDPKIYGCTTKEKIEKLLNDGEFYPLGRGTTPENKFHEVWLNGKSQMIVLAFEKPQNDDNKQIKNVCVISMTNNEIYNGDTVNALSKSLEPAPGNKL